MIYLLIFAIYMFIFYKRNGHGLFWRVFDIDHLFIILILFISAIAISIEGNLYSLYDVHNTKEYKISTSNDNGHLKVSVNGESKYLEPYKNIVDNTLDSNYVYYELRDIETSLMFNTLFFYNMKKMIVIRKVALEETKIVVDDKFIETTNVMIINNKE